MTPLGDPPLFLGYLAGVPFGWTLQLFPAWLVVNGALLAIFLVLGPACRFAGEAPDGVAKPLDTAAGQTPLRMRGLREYVLLVGHCGRGLCRRPRVVQRRRALAVRRAGSPVCHARDRLVLPDEPWQLREENRFTLRPDRRGSRAVRRHLHHDDAGPAHARRPRRRLGLAQPWHYFWASGLFSSVLDNAPTYLAFTASAVRVARYSRSGSLSGASLLDFPRAGGEPILAAISCGCVFMGALTYIGNGPNFMVGRSPRSRMSECPASSVYMVYSVTVLVPLFVLVTILFFRYRICRKVTSFRRVPVVLRMMMPRGSSSGIVPLPRRDSLFFLANMPNLQNRSGSAIGTLACRSFRLLRRTHRHARQSGPDAMAAGWGLIRLFQERLDCPVELVGGGAIVRAENRHLVDLLNPPLAHRG